MGNPSDYLTGVGWWNKSYDEPQYWIDSAYVDFAMGDLDNFEGNLTAAIQSDAARKDLLHLFQLRRVLRRLYYAQDQ